MTLAPELLQILVCPKCKGDLEYRQNPESLVCHACRLVYPVEPHGGLFGATGHQEGQARTPGGVPHPRQLSLARIGLVGKAGHTVLVAPLLPLEMLVPGHGRNPRLRRWPTR